MSAVTEAQPIPSLDELRSAYAQWRQTVEAELQGAPFDKKLVTRTFEGIGIQPVYTRADVEKLPLADVRPGEAPYLRSSQPAGYVGKPWDMTQEFSTTRAVDFNTAILSALERGQTSVPLTFDRATRAAVDPDKAPAADVGNGLSLCDLPDLAAALQGIDFRAVSLHADAGVTALPLASLLLAYGRQQKIDLRQLSGSFVADPLGEYTARGTLPISLDAAFDDLAGWTRWAGKHLPSVRTIGVNAALWLEAGGNAAQELAFALAAGVEYLRAVGLRGVSAETAAPRIVFNFAIGPTFFTEVAKFRAFRALWARVASAFGVPAASLVPTVHARTCRWNKTVLDVHVNLLRTTTEALSAVLGGVDRLTIGTFDEVTGKSDDLSQRVARNLHVLLAEEFRLTSPADPSGGSWYIERLTDELARTAWRLFQDVEKAGGYSAAIKSGVLQKQVAEIAGQKKSALDTRRLGLVGTNLYPNRKDKIVAPRSETSTSHAGARASEIAGRRPARPSIGAPADWPSKLEVAIHAAEAGATIGQLVKLVDSGVVAISSAAPVVPHRAATGFEVLRAAAETYAARTGSRPKVFLGKVGPIKQHKARADFSTGFFEVGGFEIIGRETFDTAEAAGLAATQSGASVAVLCSTDETYPTLAPAFARTIKAVDAKIVIVLAGYPADLVPTLRGAGFDEFIHVRSNVRETLAQLLTRIGATLDSIS